MAEPESPQPQGPQEPQLTPEMERLFAQFLAQQNLISQPIAPGAATTQEPTKRRKKNSHFRNMMVPETTGKYGTSKLITSSRRMRKQ